MKHILKRSIVTMLVFVMLMPMFASTAFARTWGSEDTQTIYVTTKSNWSRFGSESITLKQDKVTLTYKSCFGNKTKTKKAYGYYNITVTPLNGKKATKVEWDGTATKKIKLSRDTEYRITVQFDQTETFLINELNKAPFSYYHIKDDGYSWRVSSTCKATAR